MCRMCGPARPAAGPGWPFTSFPRMAGELDLKRHQKIGLARGLPAPPARTPHDEMLRVAFEKLRLKASYNLIGRQLLPEKFTLTHLRQLYNQIFQKEFDPGNFRKKVLSLKQLERLEEKDMSESKKGAYYYKFKEVKESHLSEPIFKSALKF